MKRIHLIVKKGKITIDFDGFQGNSCQNEENLFRLLMATGGIVTNVEHSDNKNEGELNGTAEREKLGN